jgi:hydrogenase large subunit
VQEFVPHSWYKYEDEAKGLHPWDGVTEPNYELGKNAKGTSTRIEELDESAKYSWIKAPRWRGHAMEVGRWRATSSAISRAARTSRSRWTACSSARRALGGDLLHAGPHRCPRAGGQAEKQKYFLDKLIANIKAGDTATANTAKFDPSTWPRKSRAWALPRRRAARWPLDPHQGRQDRQLPVRGAHHLERLSAR